MSYQGGEGSSDPTADVLLEKLRADGTAEGDEEDPAAEIDAILSETARKLFGREELHVDDGLVKQSLDELLVIMIALRTKDANGKGIMGDVNRFFGTKLSPGTVYPALHDLEADDLLEVRELVQTKEYFLDDADAARARIREAMQQHLAMGFLFRRILDEFDDA